MIQPNICLKRYMISFFNFLNIHHTLYWTTQGGTRASLAIMSRAYFSFNAVQVSALFCHARPCKISSTRHKTFFNATNSPLRGSFL